MINKRCFYYKNGNCTKGLTDTPCEIAGCVAHTDTEFLCWNEMTDKQKSDFLYELSHQPATTPEAEPAKGDLPVHKS